VRVTLLLLLTLVGLHSSLARADESDRWLARDKTLHATAGAALGAGGYGAGALVFDAPPARVVSGIVMSLGIGAAKEWYDRGRGDPSWRDFAWDGIGAAAGVTIAWLIDRARRHPPAGHSVATPSLLLRASFNADAPAGVDVAPRERVGTGIHEGIVLVPQAAIP
jgi:putative lipoprotein